MKPTIADIAQEAGVSQATVDRVLNGRDGVRQHTQDLVLSVAAKIGYLTQEIVPVASDVSRLAFILPAGENTFIKALRDHLIAQANRNPGIDIEILEVAGFDPNLMSEAINNLDPSFQGLGVIAIDHPSVREALRQAVKNDVKVATIASGISQVPTVGYIGIDNRAAGRLAAYIMGRFLGEKEKHKIAVFGGSLSYRGHEEREAGFKSIITGEYTNFTISDFVETKDDSEKAYEAATKMLKAQSDIAGIYSIGAGNKGIAQALKEAGIEKDVVFIGHDLTESRKSLLLDGTFDAFIDQHPRVQAREALGILDAAIRDVPFEENPPRLQIIFKENIPEL